MAKELAFPEPQHTAEQFLKDPRRLKDLLFKAHPDPWISQSPKPLAFEEETEFLFRFHFHRRRLHQRFQKTLGLERLFRKIVLFYGLPVFGVLSIVSAPSLLQCTITFLRTTAFLGIAWGLSRLLYAIDYRYLNRQASIMDQWISFEAITDINTLIQTHNEAVKTYYHVLGECLTACGLADAIPKTMHDLLLAVGQNLIARHKKIQEGARDLFQTAQKADDLPMPNLTNAPAPSLNLITLFKEDMEALGRVRLYIESLKEAEGALLETKECTPPRLSTTQDV